MRSSEEVMALKLQDQMMGRVGWRRLLANSREDISRASQGHSLYGDKVSGGFLLDHYFWVEEH